MKGVSTLKKYINPKDTNMSTWKKKGIDHLVWLYRHKHKRKFNFEFEEGDNWKKKIITSIL
jgi:hypothetical protein